MIYDNLSDKELIREADGQSGLIKALAERLEMHEREQTDQSQFGQIAELMRVSGTTITPRTAVPQEMLEHVRIIKQAIEFCVKRELPIVECWNEYLRYETLWALGVEDKLDIAGVIDTYNLREKLL